MESVSGEPLIVRVFGTIRYVQIGDWKRTGVPEDETHIAVVGSQVVTKHLKDQQLQSAQSLADAYRELALLSMLRGHPNVVSLLGVNLDRPCLPVIVMEFCAGSSIQSIFF